MWISRKTGISFRAYWFEDVKDVLMDIPKSDLLDVTVARIHVAGQRFLAVRNGLYQRRYS